MFREAELKDPNCNRKAVPLDKRRTNLISTKGIKVFADFLRRAGITSKNLSFKSFRQQPRVPAQFPRDQGKGAHAGYGPPGFLVAHALRLPLGMGIP